MVDKETRIRNFFEDEGILNQKIDREILAAINGKLSWETPADPTQLEVFVYLARLLATEQRYDEAEPVYELVAGILDQCVGRYHPDSL
ncbi:MAG: hypothetical protein GX133_12715, partial [Syntrophomonadaceae bacterium]|nr:hypothetical protein [Syntrophomonadaceae bacterium]